MLAVLADGRTYCKLFWTACPTTALKAELSNRARHAAHRGFKESLSAFRLRVIRIFAFSRYDSSRNIPPQIGLSVRSPRDVQTNNTLIKCEIESFPVLGVAIAEEEMPLQLSEVARMILNIRAEKLAKMISPFGF